MNAQTSFFSFQQNVEAVPRPAVLKECTRLVEEADKDTSSWASPPWTPVQYVFGGTSESAVLTKSPGILM